jgi:hypothetical protein
MKMAVVRRLHPFISSLDTHVMDIEFKAGLLEPVPQV